MMHKLSIFAIDKVVFYGESQDMVKTSNIHDRKFDEKAHLTHIFGNYRLKKWFRQFVRHFVSFLSMQKAHPILYFRSNDSIISGTGS